MISLTKIFPWLSIQNKLLIAFVGLSILPVAFVGMYAVISNIEMMEKIAFENLTHDVHTIREKSANFLANVERDIKVVRNSSLLRRYISSIASPRGDLVPSEAFDQLQAELLSFAQTKKIYFQIRMLDEEGNELFRIQCTRRKAAERSFNIVPPSELHHRGENYYFHLVQHLRDDQITFVPAELLHNENERIPVMSFAAPVTASNRRMGILIANVFAEDLFRVLEPTRHFEEEGKVALVSDDGYFLFHSEKKSAWNKLLASRDEDNLKHEYSPAVAAKILSNNDGIVEANDDIIAFGPLFPTQHLTEGENLVLGLVAPLTVLESVPKEQILGPVHTIEKMLIGFLLFFLVTAVGLGLLATRQFTQSIAELHHGAEIISRGNYGHRLHVETRDEIEKLAEQFNLMAASLEQHEKVIQQHRSHLEEMVLHRTREVSEEKSKLQAILDNVPSAFVLLNNQFTIQTASAAFTTVTGKRLEEVRGLDCRAVFCSNGFCQNCLCQQALRTRSICSHIDETPGPHGVRRFIEHVAVPMHENDEITSILEIITDVTDRKRLEQDLIRTEKLMAAGEMSAIIAHEFRNGLTSIKMILQLHRESKNLRRSSKKSLDVALSSLRRMEDIVTELLAFARPTPMKLQRSSFNRVLDESIDLIRPQLSSKNIRFKKFTQSSLPRSLIDESRWKDAIVNILLNAMQAIEAQDPQHGAGTITLVAKPILLRKRLRDVGFLVGHNVGEEHPSRHREQEIVLQKGTQCILIEISDSGNGIAQGDLRRIFDPFFTTKSTGTGLGLPLVKRTVDAHGGIVTVKSSKRYGTTFSIYVPCESGHA